MIRKKLAIITGMLALALLTDWVQRASAASVLDLILASGATELRFKLQNFDNGTLYPVGTAAGAAGATTLAAAHDGIVALNGVAGQTGAVGGLDDGTTHVVTGAALGAEDTWGVFIVDRILGNHNGFNINDPIWGNGDEGRELTGMFWGTRDYFITPNPLDASFSLIEGIGIRMNLFEDVNPDWNSDENTAAGLASVGGGSVNRIDADDYPTVTDELSTFLGGNAIDDNDDPGATLVLTASGESGHINDPGEFGGPMAQFRSIFDPSATTGSGTAFFSVTGGLWSPYLNSNAILPSAANAGLGFKPADIKIIFTTEPTNVGPGPLDWLVISDDPVTAFVVPEPASLALIALGLMAITGGRSRRR